MLLPIASTIKEIYYIPALRLAGGCLAVVFLLAAWSSGIAAVADLEKTKNTQESLQKAVELAPDNAAFRVLLAEHVEGSGRDPKPQLIEAMRLSRLDSQYMVRRAFRSEIENDFATTEALLLEAARIDKKAAPRWALMNFYFRRGRDPEFWAWFTKALLMSRGEVDAIFRLGWSISQDSELILSHIPNQPDLMRQYYGYLANTNRLDDAGPVAVRVATALAAQEQDLMLAYCDRYAEGDPRRALPVWNALATHGGTSFRPLNPETGNILTNETFATEPSRRGFDWAMPNVDGVTSERVPDMKAIRFTFSGDQPEVCDLLEQRIPLSPEKTYEIRWRAEVSSESPVTGLFWEIEEAGSGRSVSGPVPGSGDGGQLQFRASGRSGTLRLRHKRLPGTRRAVGTITIRNLEGRLVR